MRIRWIVSNPNWHRSPLWWVGENRARNSCPWIGAAGMIPSWRALLRAGAQEVCSAAMSDWLTDDRPRKEKSRKSRNFHGYSYPGNSSLTPKIPIVFPRHKHTITFLFSSSFLPSLTLGQTRSSVTQPWRIGLSKERERESQRAREKERERERKKKFGKKVATTRANDG